jgi:carbon-monoxide dehydrogenase large subunit
MGKYIGERILRKEDPRMVTGEAKYLEDIKISGMLYAVVKRTDYAHAKIKNIDTSVAEKNVRCFWSMDWEGF